ncbi:MAG: TerB family tellurite resistance protein [Nannocystaceae bacterium]
MKEHIDLLTNLLLGAAYSDKRLEGREVESIRELLLRVLEADALPEAQEHQLRHFNPAAFHAEAAAADLRGLSLAQRRRVLELVATINDSDDVLDLDEDRYLRRVAHGLGFSDAEIRDLTIEILDDEELPGALQAH